MKLREPEFYYEGFSAMRIILDELDGRHEFDDLDSKRLHYDILVDCFDPTVEPAFLSSTGPFLAYSGKIIFGGKL